MSEAGESDATAHDPLRRKMIMLGGLYHLPAKGRRKGWSELQRLWSQARMRRFGSAADCLSRTLKTEIIGGPKAEIVSIRCDLSAIQIKAEIARANRAHDADAKTWRKEVVGTVGGRR